MSIIITLGFFSLGVVIVLSYLFISKIRYSRDYLSQEVKTLQNKLELIDKEKTALLIELGQKKNYYYPARKYY
mgnify:CR=1 FL=1